MNNFFEGEITDQEIERFCQESLKTLNKTSQLLKILELLAQKNQK